MSEASENSGDVLTASPEVPAAPAEAEISAAAPAAEPADDLLRENAGATFGQLGLSDEVLKGIREHGYVRATPVQARAIPLALQGIDLIVRSKTGTGKTAAFGIPLIEKIPAGTRSPSALVLCPTRELALQVAEELTSLAQYKDLQVAAIYGGTSMKQQCEALRQGAEIIVGTPGRVYDHISRGTLDLSHALFGVLDEADEMLSQGFYEEVTRILEYLPESRQTLLFSATVTEDIDRLIQRFCRDPETILLSGDDYTVDGIENVLYPTRDEYPKPRNLIYLVEIEKPKSAIVFCNTRDDTTLVNAVLTRNGFDSEILNGDLPQKERERVMAKVKRGHLTFLVATDIAARGIDISDLTHVINYSLPEDPAVYLHRVGRTGRIGKKGVAISLVSGRELSTLSALEKRFDIKFTERHLPTADEAKQLWAERHIAVLREMARDTLYESMLPLAEVLKETRDGEMILAAVLKKFFDQRKAEKLQAAEREESEAEVISEKAAQKKKRPSKSVLRGACFEDSPKDRRGKPHEGVGAEGRGDAGETGDEASGHPDTKLWTSACAADVQDAEAFKAAVAAAAGVEASAILRVELGDDHGALFVENAAADAITEKCPVIQWGSGEAAREIRIERPRRRGGRRRGRR